MISFLIGNSTSNWSYVILDFFYWKSVK